ncbi:MAG: hypothetical protein UY65_C0019G0002 [Parcubacteria group bacterium GW2011_GWA2_51_12]|nr:MAG: hypothetical protein UY65_C0019G0002 [Parcubacteria group bacterium GW2011_GWA2_51_12]
MKQRFAFAVAVLVIAVFYSSTAHAVVCTPTGFFRDSINMTAALINPVGTVSGTVDGTGCNIVIYYSSGAGGTVKNANLFGANYFGILVNGDAGAVNVDILSSNIHDIGEVPHNGTQHGVAIYYRGFFDVSAATGKITGNQISAYQKGAIVANGQGTQVNITDNVTTGDGHVDFIAQNGIQVGFGASASVMRNSVSGNSYKGFPGDGSASGGVLVVGGAGYGTCPDSNDCPYTVGVMVNGNTLADNDVGIYFSNLEADFSAPTDATNNKAVNNKITDDQCYNSSYQTGISDVGNNDKMINNKISGPGYIGCYTFYNPSGALVDADTSFTNRPKVHATK